MDSINDMFPNLGAGPDNPASGSGMYLGGDWIEAFVRQTRRRAELKADAEECPSLILSGQSDKAAGIMADLAVAESAQLEALGTILAADLAESRSVGVQRLITAVKTRVKAHIQWQSRTETFMSFHSHNESYAAISEAYWQSEDNETQALAELGSGT